LVNKKPKDFKSNSGVSAASAPNESKVRPTVTVTRPVLPPREKFDRFLDVIWEKKWLTNDGELVRTLTSHLERHLKVRKLVLVSNGTVAIEIALRALGVKGEVITTPFTFSATTNVLLWAGLNPVWSDIDPETFNIDPDVIERKITKRTSAILAVHVYGNPCNVQRLAEIADQHDLTLIYDAAHAFGVEFRGQSILRYGDASTMSFHATKVFNTIEGGAVVSNDDAVIEKSMLMRNHGIRSEEEVILPGTNAKMNEFEGAMGLCNLETVEENILARKKLYERYRKNLSRVGGVGFQKLRSSKYNYSYMPVCFGGRRVRDRVYSGLGSVGIHARKYFFPLTVDFEYFRGRFKLIAGLESARKISDGILCLPLYPDLGVTTVDQICDRVIDLVKG
jgi:dTDP-4-amino-4,6-dideoxy-D-glucose transaminase